MSLYFLYKDFYYFLYMDSYFLYVDFYFRLQNYYIFLTYANKSALF